MAATCFGLRQFYETYAGDEKVSPLVTLLRWTQLGEHVARRHGIAA